MYKTKSLLGLDIRSNSIRLVELSSFGNNYKLELCINIASGDITELKKILEQVKSKTKNVAVALSHSAIIFKEIEVEQGLSDKETEDFLQFNIEKYIGEPEANISFDYQAIKKLADESTVLRLVAVRRERVEKYIKLLQVADLCPKIIDIDSYALERAVRRQIKNINGLMAIINIDYETILIVVINREKIVYAHEDFINAEEMCSIDQIIAQLKIKLSLVFASLHEPFERIILSGEKATIPELDKAIDTHFNIQTTIIDPFFGMQVPQELKQKIAPEMLISCGLALRVIDDNWN